MTETSPPALTIGFAIPGDLARPTGGYRYDRMVMELLPRFGVSVDHVALSGRYPFPDEATRRETARVMASRKVDLWLIDGLAFGAFGADELASLKAPVLVLLHHPLCDESGLDPQLARQLMQSERQALAHAQAVIVTSPATALRVEDLFGVDQSSIAVAVPGVETTLSWVDPTPLSLAEGLKLLCLGSVSPRKGYDLLLKALAPLRKRHWSLTFAGRMDDQDTAKDLQKLSESLHLTDHITWRGALSDTDLASLWTSHHALCFPSRYEGYGMVLTEALAHGVPVLSSDRVPAAKGLSEPAVTILPLDDQALWTQQIALWLDQPDQLQEARATAQKLGKTLPQWSDTAKVIAQILLRVHDQSHDLRSRT